MNKKLVRVYKNVKNDKLILTFDVLQLYSKSSYGLPCNN